MSLCLYLHILVFYFEEKYRVLKAVVLGQRVCAIAILIDTTRLHMAYALLCFDKQEKVFKKMSENSLLKFFVNKPA